MIIIVDFKYSILEFLIVSKISWLLLWSGGIILVEHKMKPHSTKWTLKNIQQITFYDKYFVQLLKNIPIGIDASTKPHNII